MWRGSRGLLFSAFFWVAVSAQAKVNYVESPALSTVVKGSIKNCGSKISQVPLITWGGDIATIVANGYKVKTQSKSIFDKLGLNFKLKREDVFADQVKAYLKCDSPFLRGTMGMINMAAPVTEKDARTKMVVVYQLTWSTGGDALVVKSGIRTPKQLKGKTIAVQAYGPHVDYLAQVLSDAGLTMKNVKIKWTKDLTGTGQTPVEALRESGVDAAMVIIPDGLALTSNGTVGTGSEDSVKGAKILLSTKTASRVISDVYAVRSDFYNKNQSDVESFVRGLLQGEEALQAIVKKKKSQKTNYQNTMRAAAQILLDSPQAMADAEGMFADATFVGWSGNNKYFNKSTYPRNFKNLNTEIQGYFLPVGLVKGRSSIKSAKWDFNKLKKGLTQTSRAQKPRFKKEQVAKVVAKKQRQGTLAEGELFSFDVYFQPNQNEFSVNQYQSAFKKVVKLSATYGGALITIEGHSDPLNYLKKKKSGSSKLVLSRIRQSAKNLSLSRANAVRDSLVKFSKRRGVTIDSSQFAVMGHGISKPASGMCGKEPCAPKTKQDWLDNMRVGFRLIQIEAEESVFSPLED